MEVTVEVENQTVIVDPWNMAISFTVEPISMTVSIVDTVPSAGTYADDAYCDDDYFE